MAIVRFKRSGVPILDRFARSLVAAQQRGLGKVAALPLCRNCP
jgi:hypothetical protein